MTEFESHLLVPLINAILVAVLLYTVAYARKHFSLAMYRKAWYPLILAACLMIGSSIIRIYISLYSSLGLLSNPYELVWIPRTFDVAVTVLFVAGIYLLTRITVQVWGD